VTGRLIAVVGPSGVGKDSLIEALCAARPGLLRARRVITRPPAKSEPFDAVSEAEFERMRATGRFALHWGAHDLHYGIPVETLTEVREGGAVIATLHDLVMAIGFFAITQIEFNMTSIAALLTILGYSLNDTVVIYDRIRESMRKYKKISVYEVLDVAVNATLSRTILTSVTTLLALMALAALGGEIIKGFAYAMIFGLVVGTYSSIFVAAPILIYLGVRASSAVGSAAQSGPDAAQPAE